MGRGLSLLQRQILHFVFKEKFVTCQEILTELWGWRPQKRGSRESAIDKDQYASAHAVLSRSLTRLWSRDLIEYWRTLSLYRTGVTLTHEGKALAKAILAQDQKKQSKG
jgi:hypothetical protein